MTPQEEIKLYLTYIKERALSIREDWVDNDECSDILEYCFAINELLKKI